MFMNRTESYRQAPNQLPKQLAYGAVAVGAVLLSGACSSADALHPAEDYRFNEHVTDVSIRDGAIIRTSPAVVEEGDRSNRIVELSLEESIDIPLQEGAAIATDFANGDWIGLDMETVAAYEDIATQIPQSILESGIDEGSIIWISSQRAIPTRDYSYLKSESQ